MRLWIEKKPLLLILSHYSGFAKKNAHEAGHPLVLKADALHGMLHISSGDSELFLTEALPCNIEEAGSATVPFHLFFEIVRKMTTPMRLSFSQRDDAFFISSQISQFTLPVLHSSPSFLSPPQGIQTSVKLSSSWIKKGLESIRMSLSTEEGRPHLNGFLMHRNHAGAFTLVATDTHRLSVFSLTDQEVSSDQWASETLVSRKVLSEWLKLLHTSETVALGYHEKCLLFRTETAQLYTRVLEGTFPPYEKVLRQKPPMQAVLERKSLIYALERVSLMVQHEKNPMVVCTFERNRLVLLGKSRFGTATETLQEGVCTYLGSAIILHVNPRYLLESLHTFPEERVSLFFGEGMTPLILEAYDDASDAIQRRAYHMQHVMMPMRR